MSLPTGLGWRPSSLDVLKPRRPLLSSMKLLVLLFACLHVMKGTCQVGDRLYREIPHRREQVRAIRPIRPSSLSQSITPLGRSWAAILQGTDILLLGWHCPTCSGHIRCQYAEYHTQLYMKPYNSQMKDLGTRSYLFLISF